MRDKKISIQDPRQIPVILDLIHDCWFDVDDIICDRETSILSIKFKREMGDRRRVLKNFWLVKKLEVPLIECFLKFYHVKSYRIRDTEHVGIYDFNELKYDHHLKRIDIITGVPIDIKIYVEMFEISVEETDKVVDVKTVTSIFS